MKILFKVTKDPSTNAWACADYMISKRVASVLPANILVIKGSTAILHGTPILHEVYNQETGASAGFRLDGVEGTLVDQLVTMAAQHELAEATKNIALPTVF